MKLRLVIALLLSAGCTKTVDLDWGSFHLNWSDDTPTLTKNGEILFQGVDGEPFIRAHRVDTQVDYGSGSFTFIDTVGEACEALTWNSVQSGEDFLTADGVFEDCGAAVSLAFAAGDNGPRIGVAVEDMDRISLRGATDPQPWATGFGAQYDAVQMDGRDLPIWCQEQGHGRGSEPVTSVLSLGEGNPAGDWHTSYTCAPWMIQSPTTGLWIENTERSAFDLRDPSRVALSTMSDVLAVSWIEGEDLPDLVSNYTQQIGRMTGFPQWTQDGVILRAHGGAEDINTVVAEAEAAGLPIAAVWIEDWCGQRSTALGTRMLWNWQVDRSKYPDWEEMISELHDKDIRVLAYINPYIVDATDREEVTRALYTEAVEQDFLVRDSAGEVFWMDQAGFEAALVDLNNPDAAAWLQSILEELIDTGVDGWMADFAEGLPLDIQVADTQDPGALHNEWPKLWADINRQALEAKGVWDDSLVFHRSGNAHSPGAARGFWIGDQLVTWDAFDGLQTVVPALITSGLSGYSMQHADTGGYLSVEAMGVTRDAELFQRWVELNAFTPLLRLHSTNQPDVNQQWNSDPETTDHLVKMVRVYAALADYRQQLFTESETAGAPVVRPLFWSFPDDETTWDLTDQFLLGDAILVAPVMTQGATTRDVYLPAGDWIHGPTGEAYTGPTNITVDAVIGAPPVFALSNADVAAVIVAAFAPDE